MLARIVFVEMAANMSIVSKPGRKTLMKQILKQHYTYIRDLF